MKNLTFANRYNADIIDEKYQVWLNNPDSLDSDWKAFFEGFELAADTPSTCSDIAEGEASIIGAINRYRALGHTQANINPLRPLDKNPALGTEQLGLSKDDLNQEFFTGNYLGGKTMKAKDILDNLEKTYCGPVGFEFMHIQDTAKRNWLQSHIEPALGQANFSKEKCVHILRKVDHAEMFEKFLHTRYVGQKRFSLQGGESIIPALNAVIEKCPSAGVKEVVMGMAHRGRLNVLANIMGKSYNFIFREFTENYIPDSIYGDGDVKYHLGFENIYKTESGEKVSINLAANPSHLEAVNPVVEGQARARQRVGNHVERTRVLPILIHGDAALAGQGIVSEVFNLANLDGYTTGGTVHFVINNQIGFTTNPEQSRSSMYCTDIAKMIDAPIFHVNGDDPQAVVMVSELALKYRQEFGQDVLVDIYCYRKLGHNESDEPGFTQPLMYKQIAQHKLVSQHYTERLIKDGIIDQPQADQIKQEFEAKLDEAFNTVKKQTEEIKKKGKQSAMNLSQQPNYSFEPINTAVDKKTLTKVAKALSHTPDSFTPHAKIQRQLDAKWKNFQAGENFDWALGEALGFGTLLNQGIPIRLSGQDSERGTFSHRHAVLYSPENRESYTPLKNIDEKQATFCVHNSALSEAAVLGFDYGYSTDYPQMLCIWEAQFGDFVNGAQVLIDQFITSGETKWQRLSSITMLLPHGYEGQGPEHSSARLERFLQACAEENIQVCNVTTPAQYFHLLRKQKLQKVIKPLVIMAPKSLLRHKRCVSKLEDFTNGHFQYVIDDALAGKKVDRVIFCSGKVYYDLLQYREDKDIKNTALVRVEQLYPLDKKAIQAILKKHKSSKKFIWCQEEPRNMGAYSHIAPELQEILGKDLLHYVGRKAAASPAAGALAIHKVEQEALVEEALVK